MTSNPQGRTTQPARQPAAQSPAQQRAAQLRAAQQRAAQLQAAQQRAAQQRSAQQRPAPSGVARSASAAAPSGRARAGAGTDDFARLMRQNTVDVAQQRGAKQRKPTVGKISLALAVICAAVDASAFALFMGGAQEFAFGVCFVVVFLTFIAAVMGFVAAVGSLGRWYGVVGVVLAFFANPVVLIVLVVFVAPEVLNTMAS